MAEGKGAMTDRRAAFAASPADAPIVPARWFLPACTLAFALPVLLRLATEVWSAEQAAQGPIILASGLWLLWREMAARPAPPAAPPAPRAGWTLLAAAIAGYLLGARTGLLSLALLSTWAALVALLLLRYGAEARRLWFPLAYLLFLVPLPYSLIGPATHVTKLWLTTHATRLLAAMGYEVARSGNTLFIDQYQLDVANGCAGFNSLWSLLAVGLLYIYLRHRADWRYAALIALAIVPAAMAANLMRIVFLVLVTHWFGDAVGQSLVHEATGVVVFALCFALLVVADVLLSPLRRVLGGR